MTTRRDFLKLTATSLALLASGGYRFATPALAADTTLRELILLCDSDQEKNQVNHLRVTDPGSIRILDVASNQNYAISLPFFGHTVDQRPGHAEQVLTFEKWGRRGAVVDIRDRKILAELAPAADNTFFGHAAFNQDGTIFVATENNSDATAGLLTFRDADGLQVVEKYSSYGLLPHQCRTPDHGKTIMVVNKGDETHAPNLSWIDWQSGKLLNQVTFNPDNHVLYGHCDLSFDHWVCVGGLTKVDNFSDMIVLISPEGQTYSPKLPKDIAAKMKGEALSIAFLGHSGLVAVTVTLANLVLLIDYKTQQLVEAISIPVPNGILTTLNETNGKPDLIVSSHKNRNMLRIDMQAHNAPVHILDADFGGIGSHLTRLYI